MLLKSNIYIYAILCIKGLETMLFSVEGMSFPGLFVFQQTKHKKQCE